MSQQNCVGDRVEATVTKLLPIGLLVELQDGSTGLIRSREISWNGRDASAWREQIDVGARVQVVVVADNGRNLELSLRLAESDPWVNIEDRLHVGQLVDGTVTGVDKFGAFIELAPAVEGLLHLSRLPEWVEAPAEELFWPGDRVRVMIDSIDVRQRQIALSMRDISAVRWHRTQPLPSAANGAHAERTEDAEQGNSLLSTPQSFDPFSSLHTYSILLVEDNAEQRNTLARWLQSTGQQVRVAQSAAEALEMIAAAVPDVLICDVGLPDTDGITLTCQLAKQHPHLCCFVMTDWITVDSRKFDVDALGAQGIELFTKPVQPHDLSEMLARVRRRRNLPDVAHVSAPHPNRRPARKPPEERAPTGVLPQLQDALLQLRRETRASKVILFAVDPAQRQAKIVAENGRGRVDERALPNLIHSPVCDVAEESTLVRVMDASKREAYVRYLTPLLTFRSCIGVPIPSRLAHQYALFLFHTEADFAGEIVEQMAKSTALVLSARLERHEFLKRARETQRFALLGHLTRALVHETNHYLTPLVFALSDLTEYSEHSFNAGSVVSEAEQRQMREAITQLDLSVQNLLKTVNMFGAISTQQPESMVNVERVVQKCVAVMRDIADRAHVDVRVQAPSQIITTRVDEGKLLQVLLNLLLNAIQQIQRLRPQQGGTVEIQIGLRRERQQSCICIRVEDDGPGIHIRHWEQIFALGFTTRDGEGSGMGLYIAEQLARDAGGRIYVEDSAVLWGTTFTVELPVTFAKASRGAT